MLEIISKLPHIIWEIAWVNENHWFDGFATVFIAGIAMYLHFYGAYFLIKMAKWLISLISKIKKTQTSSDFKDQKNGLGSHDTGTTSSYIIEKTNPEELHKLLESKYNENLISIKKEVRKQYKAKRANSDNWLWIFIITPLRRIFDESDEDVLLSLVKTAYFGYLCMERPDGNEIVQTCKRLKNDKFAKVYGDLIMDVIVTLGENGPVRDILIKEGLWYELNEKKTKLLKLQNLHNIGMNSIIPQGQPQTA